MKILIQWKYNSYSSCSFFFVFFLTFQNFIVTSFIWTTEGHMCYMAILKAMSEQECDWCQHKLILFNCECKETMPSWTKSVSGQHQDNKHCLPVGPIPQGFPHTNNKHTGRRVPHATPERQGWGKMLIRMRLMLLYIHVLVASSLLHLPFTWVRHEARKMSSVAKYCSSTSALLWTWIG